MRIPLLSARARATTAMLCLTLLFAASAHAQTTPSWVAVLPGGSSLSKMFQQCVEHYQKQGLSQAQSIGQCMAIGVTRLSSGGGFAVDSGFMGGEGPGPSAVNCTTLGLDPNIARTVHRPPGGFAPMDAPLPPLSDNYDVQKWLYQELAEMLIVDFTEEIEALREQVATTADPLQKGILRGRLASLEALQSNLFDQVAQDWYLDQLHAYVDWRIEHPGESPPGDYPLPDPDAPQVAHVGDQAVSACNMMREWVNECRLAGWKTGPCQMFIDRLNECGDPTVTDPSPDEERPCRSRPIDAATIKRVAFLACSKNTTPGPGADPCGERVREGILAHFEYDRADPNRPICSNPFAYTDAEACTPTFSVMVAPQQSVDEVIEEANELFGGPIFLVPLPGTGGPVPGAPTCYKGLPRC